MNGEAVRRRDMEQGARNIGRQTKKAAIRTDP